MLSRINLTVKSIWKKMRNKEYRDSFVAAHTSNTISAQINSMRQARGWTQGELANRSGMRQPRISALEDPDFENIEIATLQRLASAFDVALSVRFVPFSEIAERATSLTSSDFNIREYSNDLVSSGKIDHSLPRYNLKLQIVPTRDYHFDVGLAPETLARDIVSTQYIGPAVVSATIQ